MENDNYNDMEKLKESLQNSIDNEKKDNKKEEQSNTKFSTVILLFIIGVALIGFNVLYIIKESKYYPKTLFIGCFCFYYSLSLFIAPFFDFKEEKKRNSDFKPIFFQSERFSKNLKVIYIVASIIPLILIFKSETWDLPMLTMLVTFFISGILMFIKYLFVYIYLDKQIDDVERKVCFANPSKRICVIGMLAGIVLFSLSGYFGYKIYIETPKNYDNAEFYNSDMDVYLEQLLDKDVSYGLRMGSDEDTIAIQIDYDYCASDYVNSLFLPMKDIICHIVKSKSPVKELILYKNNEVTGENDLSVYTKENLLQIPFIKEMLDQNKPQVCSDLQLVKNKDKYFFQKQEEKKLIVGSVISGLDYFFIWDLDGFENYLKLNKNLKDEYNLSKEDLEKLISKKESIDDNTVFEVLSFHFFDSYNLFDIMYDNDNGDLYWGIVYNYKSPDCVYLNYYDAYDLYNESIEK